MKKLAKHAGIPYTELHLERTPTRVQENVAAVLIELIEEGTRVDVLTVITKHARDTKTGALKRVFVNPFIVPRDDGAR